MSWIQETIQAGVELAKEHPIAAAAVGVTVAAGVGYAGYRICKRKKEPALIEGTAIQPQISLTKGEIDLISSEVATKVKALL